MEQYVGYKELVLTDEQMGQLYSEGKIDGYEFLENEYLIVKDETDKVVDKLVYRHGGFEQVPFQTLQNAYLGKIKPRNPQQQLTIDSLLHQNSKIKVIKK